METLFATAHVVAAVFVIGPMAILPMTAMRAMRAGQGAQVAVLARSTFVFSMLSLLVVVFGFGILPFSKYGTTVTTPWVLASLIDRRPGRLRAVPECRAQPLAGDRRGLPRRRHLVAGSSGPVGR